MSQAVRMTVAYVCLVLFIGFAATWVLSHYWLTQISARLNSEDRVGVNMERGQLNWSWHRRTPGEVTYALGWRAHPLERIDRMMQRHRRRWPPIPSLFTFDKRIEPDRWHVVMPHWFPMLLIGIVGIVAKPRPKLKIGVRDLLVLTTIVAVAMTIVVSANARRLL